MATPKGYYVFSLTYSSNHAKLPFFYPYIVSIISSNTNALSGLMYIFKLIESKYYFTLHWLNL